ncbi:cobaltochelatase subunit CobN [Xanthovirga aplysinae]|uniref:cobaltochelatase subunit CobN n=1 Tax=Xanthovirga aplysinae TaxID=2529853 RepID=UPI0012BBE1CF|nr:cobaltochelatase subunit CobN [Xanthovirga aplysinae]MTI32346.1 cobaltochelatase subunit CobN [Xanthovirga aplysinae]
MHLIATIPGGWDPNDEGVFHIEQSAGDIVILTAADTEIAALNKAYASLKNEQEDLPVLRMANLIYLKKELTIDTYLEEVISQARLVVVRMLGGRSYYAYLAEALKDLCGERNIPLLMHGAFEPDPELLQMSSEPLHVQQQVSRYFDLGGVHNMKACLSFLSKHFLGKILEVDAPQEFPELFWWTSGKGIFAKGIAQLMPQGYSFSPIIAYRSHFLSGNLTVFEELQKHCQKNKLFAPVLFIQGLRDKSLVGQLEKQLKSSLKPSVILNTTGFSIKNIGEETTTEQLFDRLNVPVIQAILASNTYEDWKEGSYGLTPVDVAMNIALPEVDGRIISKPISFKESSGKDSLTDSDIISYSPFFEGIVHVVKASKYWVNLQELENRKKHIALVLPNYPNKDSRLANGVGLDTPASCIRILQSLKDSGYDCGDQFPEDSKELMETLTYLVTNDSGTTYQRPYQLLCSLEIFQSWLQKWPKDLLQKINQQWGSLEGSPYFTDEGIIIPGFQTGNIFVSIQPARGFNMDPQAIYHSPDLPPTWQYLAYYCWLQEQFQAHAVVHIGKHGNLEWLPGKSLALGKETCFPTNILAPIPHFYPFIINDPGEGAQAKRRTQAIILDHLVPPMTRAETYGGLIKLEHLVDEYYDAAQLDQKRADVIRQQIQSLVQQEKLDQDLNMDASDPDDILMKLDGYLCELKEAQIREGLHIYGLPPKGESLVDLLIALHRSPLLESKGLIHALALEYGTMEDPVLIPPTDSIEVEAEGTSFRNAGKWLTWLEEKARVWVRQLVETGDAPGKGNALDEVKACILNYTLPKILATDEEIKNLIKGLSGAFVPSGPSGAPTRGRADILPTGRNFYSVDTRTVPTQAAWKIGERSASLIIERYLQEHGEYPETIGISTWGTSTMRTGGDDLAQAMALIGVRPVWQKMNRRVVDFEVISLMQLGRPRVDVTLRISGFFRDAFPDLINLFQAAVEKVAHLDEDFDDNPIRKRFVEEKSWWKGKGIGEQQAKDRSLFRVFGSKPGAYGAGLQALIDEKNWKDERDLANVYINWSSYAYGSDQKGVSAHEAFRRRLKDMQIVMHNQDNREHDILDSDDYYQFQGGLSAAVSVERGEKPALYFGDNSKIEQPKVKSLKEELLKVYRSRAVNPKWIESIRKHGYKGAFEQAATMDYLFAWDATTNEIEDFMYEGMSKAYLTDPKNKAFLEEHNPWALRDMSERMLEAINRGMWQNPSEEIKEQLQEIWQEADCITE